MGLRADAAGDLVRITFGGQDLGRDEAAFERLGAAIRRGVTRSAAPLSEDVDVEIDADDNLHYRHVLRAVAACTGGIDPQTKSLVRAVETVRFATAAAPRD